MTPLESNLYWRKRRQTILQSLNAQPSPDLPCTCTQALSTSNSSTCSSCTLLSKTPDTATTPCTCKQLDTTGSAKCRVCCMSPSLTRINNSPLKLNGHATFPKNSSQFVCQHQGLVPNNKKQSCLNSSLNSSF